MRWMVDAVYLLFALATAPIWLIRMVATGKIRTDWSARFGRGLALPPARGPRVLLHAVSVGEVNAIRQLVPALLELDPAAEIVVATTTDTGFARATSVFAEAHEVVRYPFDFSFAVRRFLDRIDPDLIVLVELEVWPNLTAACTRRGIPVAVVNGRLSARSHRRYGWVGRLVAPSFRRLALAAVQTTADAERFESVGVAPDRIEVTGTMKWDTAEIADAVEGADALADEMGIDRARPLVVAGSTAPEEHRLLHAAVPDGVQLLCAPRKPEWFDAAANDLPGCARRSTGDRGSTTGRFLLDTIGELRRAYALADLVVVGRSFGQLHGSDMIEPIALGKPTVIGPAVTDFAAVMERLRADDAIVQVTPDDLAHTLETLLGDRARCRALTERGRDVVRREQGATRRNAQRIAQLLETPVV